ncbi:hypothetical protein [Sorangium sp. So ce1024]|uniref:hypothetical protein n=1 Tax=Sorangium sp. So ce1024 TaxID=3133327 RepID=UPI003F081D27
MIPSCLTEWNEENRVRRVSQNRQEPSRVFYGGDGELVAQDTGRDAALRLAATH